MYSVRAAAKTVDLVRLAVTTRPTEGAIIAAAVETFAQKGFATTRVEDILQAAGVARRTFYKHFRGKEEVLSAIYDLATTELLKVMQGAARVESDPLDTVRRGLDLYLDYHVANAPLVRVLVEQAIRSDSPLAGARQKFRHDLVSLLDVAVRASTGEAHDPMLYAALLSALEGLSMDLLATGARAADVARAKEVLHLLLARVLG